MRIALWTAVLCVILGGTSPLNAGLYLPAEELTAPPYSNLVSLGRFEDGRTKLQLLGTSRLATDQEKVQGDSAIEQLRRRYLEQIATLEQKQADGTLTVIDRVNLSGYYLRLFGPGNGRRAQQAIDVLTQGGRTPIDSNFMVLSNLSTALSLRYAGDPEVLGIAYDYLKQAVDDWPTVTSAFPKAADSEGYLLWYYRAERLQLDLLRLRRLELEQRKSPDSVDNLFPVLQKEWAKGYSVGRLRPAAFQLLPADPVDLVGQLVLWMPHDERLHWLMAELLNAVHNDFADAEAMTRTFDQSPGQKPAWHHLMHEHRRAWLMATGLRQVLQYDLAAITEDTLRFSQGVPLHDGDNWNVVPLTLLPLPEGALPMLQTVGLAVAVDKRNNTPGAKREGSGGEPPPPPAEAQQTASNRWSGPDWKTMVVSFAAGALVSLLVSQQWRQYQKKKQLQATANEYLAKAGDKDSHIKAAP
jgi:hypothetical protein